MELARETKRYPGPWSRLRRLVLGRMPSLSQRFFFAALVVVIFVMLALGAWIGNYLAAGIAKGVGETAAASIESLISSRVGDLPGEPGLQAKLQGIFEIANNAESTRLLQIRIHDRDGGVLYQSLGGIIDETDQAALQGARDGGVTSQVTDLPIQPVGGLPRLELPVLKIYAPLRSIDTNRVFGVAELYFSARAVREIQQRAQFDVWIIVGVIGFFAVGMLAAIIDATGTVIAEHRRALASNLLQTRRLLGENQFLHKASEELRVQANVANERVLARVGSDIHDGPLQLLTLLILRLTRARSAQNSADLDAAVSVSTEAMEELRSISSGLVLPELAGKSLEETIELAIVRYENQTGRSVTSAVSVAGIDAGNDVKVCAYRVVQECLSNAFRHGAGDGEAVMATTDGMTLVLNCTNRVRAPLPDKLELEKRDRLGLRAMRFRIQSIGGTLAVEIGQEAARVEARIPLHPSHAQS